MTSYESSIANVGIQLLVNQARAVRVAELINDYRTLLLHISQQQVDVPAEDYYEEGYTVLRECHAAAQQLLSANYQPCPVTGQGSAETEKAELQRYLRKPASWSN